MRRILADALTFVVIGGIVLFLWAIAARADSGDLCGREWRTQSGWVSVVCIDYPALRWVAPQFPDRKGQQAWVRSSDETIRGFRVALRARDKVTGEMQTLVQYVDRHAVYASGAFWLLGEVEVVGVTVTEVRDAISYQF